MQLDGLWDGDGGDLTMDYTRQEFDKLIEPYAKQAMDTVKKVQPHSLTCPIYSISLRTPVSFVGSRFSPC